MKQGILFGTIVLVCVFGYLYLTMNKTTEDLEVAFLKNGEPIEITSPNQISVYWIIEDKVLKDQAIIDFYDFDLTVDQLLDVSLVDFEKIYATSGANTEINMIHIVDGDVIMYEANCADKVCVKVGVINKLDQLITCIPNKLVIKLEVKGTIHG